MTILDEILSQRRTKLPQKAVLCNHDPLPYFLEKNRPQIIAEIKKGSPSLGLRFPDLDVVEQARLYEKMGASAISVLTEEDFFFGSVEDLKKIREQVNLPILRKDFILTEDQIIESKNIGAHCVLLIVAAIGGKKELRHLMAVCDKLKINALVEIHNRKELETALEIGASIIGINNRNLKTFQTDIKCSLQLIKEIPKETIAVSESGIHHPDQVKQLFEAGFDALLIGEGFLKNPGFAEQIRQLTS